MYKSQFKKVSSILRTGIASLILEIFIVVFVVVIYSFLFEIMMMDSELDVNETQIVVSIIMLILTVLLSIIIFVLNIVNAIKILSTKWIIKKVDDMKIIWGIFSIIILGGISGIVFGAIARKQYKNIKDNDNDILEYTIEKEVDNF